MNTRLHRLCIGLVVALGAGLLAADAQAIIGRPFTPMSYAGVARRTTRRMVYGAAAYGAVGYGAVGYGAAAYGGAYYAPPPVPVGTVETLPAGCVPGEPCNGTVYRPAYVGGDVVYSP